MKLSADIKGAAPLMGSRLLLKRGIGCGIALESGQSCSFKFCGWENATGVFGGARILLFYC